MDLDTSMIIFYIFAYAIGGAAIVLLIREFILFFRNLKGFDGVDNDKNQKNKND